MMNVCVAGMGWVTPAGRNLPSVWQAIRENNRPAPASLENPISKRAVPVFRVPEDLVRDVAALPRLRRSSSISRFAVAASSDAVVAAGMTPEKLARTALICVVSDGGVAYTRRFYADLVAHGEGAGSPLLFPETVYNAPASHIAAALGLQGEVLTLVGDAASGLAAMRTGCELLAVGDADYCLICAAQELDWITCEAYVRWDLIQSGFNEASLFSEGAAAILLERASGPLMVSATHAGYSCPSGKDARDRLDAVIADLLPGSRVVACVSGAAGTRLDAAELDCLRRLVPAAKVLRLKPVLGESLSCSALQQVIAGALLLGEIGDGDALVTSVGYGRQVSGLILTRKRTA
jgi:hypothetical protein